METGPELDWSGKWPFRKGNSAERFATPMRPSKRDTLVESRTESQRKHVNMSESNSAYTKPQPAMARAQEAPPEVNSARRRISSVMMASESMMSTSTVRSRRPTHVSLIESHLSSPSASLWAGRAPLPMDAGHRHSVEVRSRPISGVQPLSRDLAMAFEASRPSVRKRAVSFSAGHILRRLSRRSWAAVLPADQVTSHHHERYSLRTQRGCALLRRLVWDVLQINRTPDRGLRHAWDALQLANMALHVTMVPFFASFVDHGDGREAHGTAGISAWSILMLSMDVLYALDMAMQTRLSFVDEAGCEVVARSRVARRYARSWLLMDLMTVVPCEMIAMLALPDTHPLSHGRGHRLVKGLHYIKLLRLLRLLWQGRAVSQLEPYCGRAAASLLVVLALALLLLHVLACLFHWVAAVHDVHDVHDAHAPPAVSAGGADTAAGAGAFWLSNLTWLEAAGLQDASAAARYRTSVYWVCAIITTTGYGDILPGTFLEVGFAMFAMLLALSVFSYFMTTVSAAARLLDAQGKRAAELQEEAEHFVRAHRFPAALRTRIRAYFRFAAQHGIGDVDAHLIGGLSLQLQQDVLLSMHYRLLRAMPFFAAQSTPFMLRIVQVLEIVAVPPGEVVVMQGVVSVSMFFVSFGSFSRVVSDDAAAFREEVIQCRVRRLRVHANDLLSSPSRWFSGSWLPHVWGTWLPQWQPLPDKPLLTGQEGVLDGVSSALYRVHGTYSDGDHFGEESCILCTPSKETVVADAFCKCAQLFGPDLTAVMDSFAQRAGQPSDAGSGGGERHRGSDGGSLGQAAEDQDTDGLGLQQAAVEAAAAAVDHSRPTLHQVDS
eukprot:jgi/Ulvmu1/12654/UM094_0010.1